MTRRPLHVSRVRELFEYDEATGILTRRVAAGTAKAGNVAGWIGSRGARRVRIGGQVYQATHLAFAWMAGVWPRTDIEHIDGDRANDAWANLQLATRSQSRRGKPDIDDLYEAYLARCVDADL